MPPDVRIQ